MTSKSPVFFVHPDRQGESPEAFLGDHPVAHVGQPFELAVLPVDAVRQPADLPRDVLDLVAPVHVDEPFIDEPKDQFVTRPPAVRIDVRIGLDGDQQVLCFELLEDQFGRLGCDRFPAGEVTEVFAVCAVILAAAQ